MNRQKHSKSQKIFGLHRFSELWIALPTVLSYNSLSETNDWGDGGEEEGCCSIPTRGNFSFFRQTLLCKQGEKKRMYYCRRQQCRRSEIEEPTFGCMKRWLSFSAVSTSYPLLLFHSFSVFHWLWSILAVLKSDSVYSWTRLSTSNIWVLFMFFFSYKLYFSFLTFQFCVPDRSILWFSWPAVLWKQRRAKEVKLSLWRSCKCVFASSLRRIYRIE